MNTAFVETTDHNANRYRGMNSAFVRKVWEKRRQAKKDAAIKAFNDQQANALAKEIERASPAKAFILEQCDKHGMSYDDLIFKNRQAKNGKARMAIMVETANAFPGYSLNMIGRLFNRHHSTILHAVRMAKG